MEVDHEEVVTSECQKVCPICGNLYTSKGSLTRHMISHEGRQDHICDECGKTFDLKSKLVCHKSKVHWKENQVCPQCGVSYKSNNALRNHQRYKHGHSQKTCDHCSKTFKDKYALERHKKSLEKIYVKCVQCGKSVKHMANHLKTCQKGRRERNFNCHVCNKSYSTKSTLRRHIKYSHTDIQRPNCDCGKSFASKSSLATHKANCCSKE